MFDLRFMIKGKLHQLKRAALFSAMPIQKYIPKHKTKTANNAYNCKISNITAQTNNN